MDLPIYTVNVFSETGISGGNQLGVVLDAEDLDEEQMQAIANQLNYSESTFISNMTDTSADVRIFLPNREIVFAGHPLVGTSFVLERIWRENMDPRDEIRLNLKSGEIRVTFENPDDNSIGVCTFDQLSPRYFGKSEDTEYIAGLLGISHHDIVGDMYLIAPTDLPFLFVPVSSLKVLNGMKPRFQRLFDEYDDIGGEPYVFCNESIDGGDYHARYFAPKSGINEDPATGSAQAAFAMALGKMELIDNPQDGFVSFVTEQGYKMGRPSKLHNNCEYMNGALVHTRTGGNNYLVIEGRIYT